MSWDGIAIALGLIIAVMFCVYLIVILSEKLDGEDE